MQGKSSSVINIGHIGEVHYFSLKNRGDGNLSKMHGSGHVLHVDDKDQFFTSLHQNMSQLASVAVPPEVKEFAALISSQVENVRNEQNKYLGKKVLFMGQNGVGKSWIINLMLLLNNKPESLYKTSWNPKDVSHALAFFNNGGESGQMNKYSKDDLETISGPRHYSSADPELEEGEIPMRNQPFAILKEQLKQYCAGSALDPKRLKNDVFFLPSQAKGRSTTPCLTQIRHGSKWELLSYYKCCAELQSEAYEWISHLKEIGAPTGGYKAEEAKTEERYKRLVADPWMNIVKEPERWGSIQSKDIELHPDILEKAGKASLCSSAGFSSNGDRRLARDQLATILNCNDDVKETAIKEKRSRHTSALKAVYAFVPCGIVEDEGQVADSPGTDDQDPFKIDALKTGLSEYETVVVVLERELGAKASIVETLCSSDFLNKVVKFPSRYNIAFLHYLENIKGNNDDFDNIVDGNQREIDKLKARNLEMEELTRSKITELVSKLGSLETNEAQNFVRRHVTVATVYPTLFASVSLNTSFRVRFDSPEQKEMRGNSFP